MLSEELANREWIEVVSRPSGRRRHRQLRQHGLDQFAVFIVMPAVDHVEDYPLVTFLISRPYQGMEFQTRT